MKQQATKNEFESRIRAIYYKKISLLISTEKQKLKDENSDLHQKIMYLSLLCQTLATRSKIKFERLSLVMAIKLLQTDVRLEIPQPNLETQWQTKKRHKQDVEIWLHSGNKNNGKQGSLQLQNQFNVLSECESDHSESNTMIQSKSAGKPNRRQSERNSNKVERRQKTKGNTQEHRPNLGTQKDKNESKSVKLRQPNRNFSILGESMLKHLNPRQKISIKTFHAAGGKKWCITLNHATLEKEP